MITRRMSLEKLVTVVPESVRYLMERGIKPMLVHPKTAKESVR